MATLTLDYETPHFLQSLIAHDENLLKTLASVLGLKVTLRDAWVKLEGEEVDLVTGQKVFAQLEKAHRGGAEINAHFFHFALDTEKLSARTAGAQADSLENLTSIRLSGSPRKPPIIARTRTQLAYLQAIRSHDVTFGIVLPQEKADEVPAEVRTVAEARWAARTAKDWAESDRLRGELDALGWAMKDGREDYTLTRK